MRFRFSISARKKRRLVPALPAPTALLMKTTLAAEDTLLRYDKPGNTEKAIELYKKTLERSHQLRSGCGRSGPG